MILSASGVRRRPGLLFPNFLGVEITLGVIRGVPDRLIGVFRSERLTGVRTTSPAKPREETERMVNFA